MKSFKAFTLSLVLAVWAHPAHAIDLNEVQRQLKSDGVEGWMHGSVDQFGLYAFTIRNPKDFFDYVIVSLVDSDSVSRAKLSEFLRHDKVRIRGEFLENPSPQKHVRVNSIEVVKKFESPTGPMPDHDYQAKLPDDLKGLNLATFLVHAIGGEGHILVTEFKDVIVPIYVKDASLTKNLFRNDIIEAKIKIQSEPNAPTHVRLLEREAQPLRVIERIQDRHGQSAEITGALVMFQKSPEIIFNVFAVQETLSHGLSRQFTIVNLADPEVFAKIRQKLQQAWDNSPGATNGRNKLISKNIKVKVKGVYNVVSPNQANVQILIESADQITVITD